VGKKTFISRGLEKEVKASDNLVYICVHTCTDLHRERISKGILQGALFRTRGIGLV
jgi:hypothetical protein